MTEYSLQLSDIHIRRSGRNILDIDNIIVKKGEFVNIIGTNGAGKTTFLKLICGLIKPSRKAIVKIEGTNINSVHPWQKNSVRRSIGYIPQFSSYNTELPFTVREIALMGLAGIKPIFSRYTSEDKYIVDKQLDELGLGLQKGQVFGSLSGGEQQKVLIARALVQKPTILLLDEPTSSLDFNWKLRITELIKSLHKKLSLTVIQVTHELNAVSLDADRTILIDSGVIVRDGETRDVLCSHQLQQIYDINIDIIQKNNKNVVLCTALREGVV
ncbi:MAG: ABC transporter ATP-binding protein [Sedimentisphaeraceae bacterium JB056]